MEKVIKLPSTISDIENKKLKLNNPNKCDWTNIFACLRFMSQWFQKPSVDEIEIMLKALKRLSKERSKRNILKLFNYVWGKTNARRLLKKLWVYKDIFNY